ncbi:SSU ribosomal protein S8p (S15Ae) [Helicobacter heilmannii]|uniref:30S ribosomal protein S8 n=1 Tax=Helicobacter heilmannii TaxID=35817 RepID=UPI0006A1D51B|nr:30S ribosomal protein S8 [Helicobacter heilmannii]CRF48219.1 SSU ribosomal protein S8p (S15Ae) [Helicobacter heilmannii]CRF51467.1 SSU ribosomal protein S8p (S15Ae) [Helicobacter heilmannii]
MVNDIVADSLTRIRNASMRRLEVTELYYAKIVVSILDIFKNKGFITNYNVIEKAGKPFISVELTYDENGKAVINEIKRLSKPGRRVYRQSKELKRFKNGYGVVVVSTSKGVITNEEAYKQNVGGEVLCSIW